jgi:hypothetical protein
VYTSVEGFIAAKAKLEELGFKVNQVGGGAGRSQSHSTHCLAVTIAEDFAATIRR